MHSKAQEANKALLTLAFSLTRFNYIECWTAEIEK